MGTCSAVCFADVEVGGFDVGCEDGAAGTLGASVVGVCGNKVEQLVDGGVCGFGGGRFL